MPSRTLPFSALEKVHSACLRRSLCFDSLLSVPKTWSEPKLVPPPKRVPILLSTCDTNHYVKLWLATKLIILNQTHRHGLHVIPLFFFFFNLEFKCRMSDLYFNKMRQDLKFKDAKQQTVVSRHFLIICCFCN